jgi:hypothetical protein
MRVCFPITGQIAPKRKAKQMQLIQRNGITTRKDGLPYDVIKTEDGYQFRATGNPAKPVVIATTKSMTDAMLMLVAQAPEAADLTAMFHNSHMAQVN